MKRAIGPVLLLAVFAFLVSIPGWSDGSGGGGDDYEATRITQYRADFTVAADGDLTAVETITVDVPAVRHGIFRFFDTHDPSAPHARRIPEDIGVTQDGAPATVALSWRNHHRERVVQIGDANRYLTFGAHTYVISYKIPGVLEKGTDGTRTQFYWNLIPGGWAQAIDQARLTVHLPTAASSVRCAIGAGASDACTASGVGSSQLTVVAANLAPRTPVTIKAGLDLPTPAAGHTVPWSGKWDAVLGGSPVGPIVAAVLAVLAAGCALLLRRRAHEDDPGFPVQYAPPEGIGPAQAEFVRSETVGRPAYVASILYAADKGAISLTQDGSKWTIADTGRGWQGIDKVSQEVYELIGTPKGSFTASPDDVTSGHKLANLSGAFPDRVKKWALDSGNLAKIGGVHPGGIVAVVALLVAIGWVLIGRLMLPSMWAMVPAAFAAFGLGLLGAGAATRRTSKGRELWSRVGGFYRLLSTTSAQERFDFAGRKDLYTAYLPWAVAFGCADTWAEKFRTETGTEPPMPEYFFGAGGASLSGSSIDSLVDSFDSSVSSAISSYEATQVSSSSGSSGFSGGGFSGGGGGGGGGGGSW